MVGKGTNQHGNGFALSTYVLLLLLRFTTYSHPTFGFATAHAHSTSSVASAGTSVHLGIGNFAASSRTPIRCPCVSIYDSVPFPLSSCTFAFVRPMTHSRDLEPLYHPTLSFPLFRIRTYRHPDTFLGPADKTPCVECVCYIGVDRRITELALATKRIQQITRKTPS